MHSASATILLDVISPDVQRFAADHQLEEHVANMWRMTNTLFAGASLSMRMEEDPEIAGEQHILFEVDVGGWDPAIILARRRDWMRELFENCPAAQSWAFCLGMV